jgi:hypothetical protein
MNREIKNNFCQVSLARDIPIILENYYSFKKFYEAFNIFIICPKNQINEFKTKLNFQEIRIIDEDTIISFYDFNKIFNELSGSIKYKGDFHKRLGWYYQQILKICFVLNFINSKKENIVIWDADTIILKKINFFKDAHSIKYATLFEFHKEYFQTNEKIIGKLPNYYISSLVQFIGISVLEYNFFIQNVLKLTKINEEINLAIPKIILQSIFESHREYNGSLFSEYELIGILNYILNKTKQTALFTLRNGLDGKLTKSQIALSRVLNVKHVTYEHSHLNKNSQGMLKRNQKWSRFLRILLKEFIKFHLRNLRHNFKFFLKKSSL